MDLPSAFPARLGKAVLTIIEKKEEETRFITHSVHWSEKENVQRIPAKNFQFSLSYDFDRSSFHNIPGIFPVFRE